MNRRDFIKTALASGALYAGGGFPVLGRVAQASGFPVLTSHVLVNIMLAGGPDFRHLFTPPFDPNSISYGFRYWEARAQSHSIEQTVAAYQSRWEDDYFHVNDSETSFGILRKCGWLKRMWDAGNVAIVSNSVGGITRNHAHCQLILNQGNLSTEPNDLNRPGWGGRLTFHAGGNMLALTRTTKPFAFGLDPTNLEQHDNRNVISARNTRQLVLYKPGADLDTLSHQKRISRSLRSYYAALRQQMSRESPYYKFVEHERSLRELGEPIEARLSTVPLPDSISELMTGSLSKPYLGEQIRNLHDCFACSDILSLRAASLELDGWDSHRMQRSTIEPMFEDLFGENKALDVLFQELPLDTLDKAVFIIGGEFGRQLRANGDNGTDHGQGTCILVIGNGVRGGVYGEMFPEEELDRLDDDSPHITGLTTVDSIYSQVCDWIHPATGDLVFPDRSLSMVESNVNLGSLFL